MFTEERDRRVFPRHQLSTPIGVDTGEDHERAGMIRDLSAGGVLFQIRADYRLGQEVDIRFRPPGSSEDLRTRGTVVRVARVTELDALFHHQTAVRFHEPLELSTQPGGFWPRMVIPN